MPNLNYNRSRSKEYQVLHDLQKEGNFAVRSAGSHSVADVLAIRPADCGRGDHFEVEFIQIKVSQNLVNPSISYRVEDVGFPVNVKLMKFPVKSKEWRKNEKTKKAKRNSKHK